MIAALFAVFALNAAPAAASSKQLAMFEDDIQLRSDPAGTIAALRQLGVSNIRLSINWQNIAPDPKSHHKPHGFHGQDPAAYPRTNWTRYDSIMWQAAGAGISVGIMVTGPGPEWAVGPGEPKGAPPGDLEALARRIQRVHGGARDPLQRPLQALRSDDGPPARQLLVDLE